MTLTIGTNLASLSARRDLGRNEQALQTAIERLSSGLRVNGARDDAAGLAIAARMTSRIRGSAQAVRNVNDGISLLQIGEQAMASMTDRLQRVRELAVQALDGSLGGSDRDALDREVGATLSEVDRVAGATTFNGHRLLDGSYGIGLFQIGAGASDQLSVDLSTSVRTAHLGAIATATSADLRTLNASGGGGGFVFAGTYTTTPLADLDFSRPDVPLTPASTVTTGALGTNYAGAGQAAVISVDARTVSLNANYGSLGGVASAIQAQLSAALPGGYVVSEDGAHLRIARTPTAADPLAAVTIAAVSGSRAAAFAANTPTPGIPASANSHAGFTVDGHRVDLTADYRGNAGGLLADIRQQLDGASPGGYRVSGGVAGISISHASGVVLPVVGGFTDTGAARFGRSGVAYLTLHAGDLSVRVGTAAPIDIVGNFTTPEALADGILQRVGGVRSVHIDQRTGRMNIHAREAITLGGAQAAADGALAFTQATNPPTGSLGEATVRSDDDAKETLLRVDAAIDTLSDRRGAFGATLARLDAIVAEQEEQATALSAARGRLLDADFAVESAQLARGRMLQQAALAVIAQANSQPRGVLELLRV